MAPPGAAPGGSTQRERHNRIFWDEWSDNYQTTTGEMIERRLPARWPPLHPQRHGVVRDFRWVQAAHSDRRRCWRPARGGLLL